MSSFPSNEEFDVYLATQRKGETAIPWEELASNKIYQVVPAPVELNKGFRYKLMDVVDAENQSISVWAPVDIYNYLIKQGLDSYFRILTSKIRGKKRKSTDYEVVFFTNHGKMRCLHHTRPESVMKEIRKILNIEKDGKITEEKKKEQQGSQVEEKKMD